MKVQGNTIYADEGKWLNRKGEKTQFKAAIMFPDESDKDYEEKDVYTDEKPDYGEQVDKMIRERYTLSEELAILRQKETKPEEYKAYFDFCEDCKKQAKININVK